MSGQRGVNRMANKTKDLFDLDVQVKKTKSDAEPQITSKFLCTPGCANTGTFNSYCC